MLENDTKEELLEAYREFTGSDDMNVGITYDQLRITMKENGARLSDEELA